MNSSQQAVNQLIQQVEKAVIGQSHVVKALVLGLLTNGHVLLEGLPGTAKTRSVKALANAFDASFGRIQFTPDLLPSDVTGTEIYQVLADEINRAPAKVQAALLEAMEEGTVTIGDKSHQLPPLFMVLATQNPIEQEGTYPLPEAQLDRFMLKVSVGYPDDAAEREIIRLVRHEEKNKSALKKTEKSSSAINEQNSASIDPEHIYTARRELAQVEVSDLVEKYMVGLVMATRHPQRYPQAQLSQWIAVGSSPRASIALDKCARAHAWLAGRDHILPDDVRAVAEMVFAHRLVLSYDALADGVSQQMVVNELLDHVAIG